MIFPDRSFSKLTDEIVALAIGFLLLEALDAAASERGREAAAGAISKRLAGAEAKVIREEVLGSEARFAITLSV